MSEKLPRITAREIIHVIERKGFYLSRQSGSHMIYKNNEGKRTTIPFHASVILHPKIIKAILKDSEMTVDQLRELL